MTQRMMPHKEKGNGLTECPPRMSRSRIRSVYAELSRGPASWDRVIEPVLSSSPTTVAGTGSAECRRI
ncbi:hypothetical protein GCM10022232_45660 [Streptomyces plumbiresistens]|uniref:Transposase n=1 Tax=Streptomyces plumbiresistens TaxID=511811 RepID=A0ABP7RTK9_9ACTN